MATRIKRLGLTDEEIDLQEKFFGKWKKNARQAQAAMYNTLESDGDDASAYLDNVEPVATSFPQWLDALTDAGVED